MYMHTYCNCTCSTISMLLFQKKFRIINLNVKFVLILSLIRAHPHGGSNSSRPPCLPSLSALKAHTLFVDVEYVPILFVLQRPQSRFPEFLIRTHLFGGQQLIRAHSQYNYLLWSPIRAHVHVVDVVDLSMFSITIIRAHACGGYLLTISNQSSCTHGGYSTSLDYPLYVL